VFLSLLNKEWRELAVSRPWWILLLCMGPLTGVSFISAARTYAEVSGMNGTSAGVGEALSPLVGVWAPTFSAAEIAAVFLLPFVAIRLVSADRQNGALKLELQRRTPVFERAAAKGIVALAGWMLAMLPPLSSVALWRGYGGSIYGHELAAVLTGHVLNAGLTIALAAATAAIAEHPSTAAILTLGATVGTWIVSFFGAVHGGWWEKLAGYTPAAMVGEFQHGLVRLETVLIAIVLSVTGLSISAIWMRLGVPAVRRALQSAGAAALAAGAILACSSATPSWDMSESRINSFSMADEAALRRIPPRLRIEAHLAMEDPRRIDLEARAFSKLRRVMPHVQVDYVAATTIGLFEQTRSGYGEIWYHLDGRKTMSRTTTSEGVLEAIYSIAGVEAPGSNEEEVFRGRPLAAAPKGAAILFYGLWPAIMLAGALLVRRRFL
jgi:hypothetical protein